MLQKTPNAIWRQPVPGVDSYERAQQYFASELASDQYPCGYPSSLKGTFERAAVQRMLALLPARGSILDCPSGTGRVAELMLKRGLTVKAVDISAHMIERCRRNMMTLCPGETGRVSFGIEDITRLSFADKSFDGAICNRLLHHYQESETRILALSELARVSRGPVIVSFTNLGSVSIARRRVALALSGSNKPVRGISCAQMEAEFDAAGMDVVVKLPVMGGLSRMCYMAGQPRSASSSD